MTSGRQQQLGGRTPPARATLVLSAGLAVVLPGIIGGCGLDEWARNGGRVGPNYKAPPVAVAENWIDYQDPRVKSQEQDLSHWWNVFDDPVLNGMLNQAYEQN